MKQKGEPAERKLSLNSCPAAKKKESILTFVVRLSQEKWLMTFQKKEIINVSVIPCYDKFKLNSFIVYDENSAYIMLCTSKLLQEVWNPLKSLKVSWEMKWMDVYFLLDWFFHIINS